MIEPSEEEMEVEKGTKVTLICFASGFPIPMVSWALVSSAHRSATSPQTQTAFARLEVTVNEESVYECTATNSAGVAREQRSFRIKEQVTERQGTKEPGARAPIIVRITDPEDDPVVVTRGESVQMICEGRGEQLQSVAFEGVRSRPLVSSGGVKRIVASFNPNNDILVTCTAVSFGSYVSTAKKIQVRKGRTSKWN